MKVFSVTLMAATLGLSAAAGQHAEAASHGQTGGQGAAMMGQNLVGPGLTMPR